MHSDVIDGVHHRSDGMRGTDMNFFLLIMLTAIKSTLFQHLR